MKANYIVINGVRYDYREVKGEVACDVCELKDICDQDHIVCSAFLYASDSLRCAFFKHEKELKSDLIVKADGTITKTCPANGTDYSLEEMQQIVGGYIEIISSQDGKEIMVLNEEGMLIDGMKHNEVATAKAWTWGYVGNFIMGDVLICDQSHVK